MELGKGQFGGHLRGLWGVLRVCDTRVGFLAGSGFCRVGLRVLGVL